MQRTILLLTALLWFVSAAAQSRTEEFTVHSDLLGREKTCSVYLPDGYDADTVRRYPVLYLLHGASDTHTAWLDPLKGQLQRIADETISGGRALPMIVVMPDAGGDNPDHTGPHMGYFDDGDWPYERFFFEEFLPAVEQHYRILPDKRHRAIAGLSMGGGGSAAYALRHPELFGSSCPLSAAMGIAQTDGLPMTASERSLNEQSPLFFLQTMTGEQADAVRTVRWRVDCGDDDFLWEGNIRFFELMRRRGLPLEFRMRDGGHTWRYWRSALPDILTFISMGFAE